MIIPGNPFKLLQKLTPKPPTIPTSQLKGRISKQDIEAISRLGLTFSELSQKIALETTINYDRSRFYTEVTKALEHWFVGPALGLYADYATSFNHLHNASVWITSKSSKYQKELTKLLERIGIEEKILDWGWTVGGYGDLFIEIKGQPELGVVSINDDEHPLNISRIDHEGCLVGFYRTPQGNAMTGDPQAIVPPWQWVHARMMGAKRKRSVYGDPMYAEFRCLRGDTRIYMLDGSTPTIKEMSDNYDKYVGKQIWSVNPQTRKFELDKIVSVGMMRPNSQLVRVHLDNNKHIDCSPDHKIMMRDGSYKVAMALEAGDSLMPLYTRNIENRGLKYRKVYNDLNKEVDVSCESDDAFKFEHRLIAEELVGHKLSSEEIAHHKDLNSENNDPGNFEIVSKLDHPENCGCSVCRNLRGDAPKHKIDCKCSACVGRRTPSESRKCLCGCGQDFVCKVTSKRKYINGHQSKINGSKGVFGSGNKTHKLGCKCFACSKVGRPAKKLLNHKVMRVEWLNIREDAYDLSIEKNHNFPTTAGVFVSNTMHMMTGIDTRQISSRYGVSLLVDALPTYKRLRLAEDSILMARLTRGILRYVWKLRVNSQNAEATEALMSQLTGLLKKARALDTSAGSPNFDSKFSVLANNEDLIIPVWGDSTNDLSVEKIGGDVDIRWIVDVEELRQQLACTLRVPLALLGGYTKEATGPLGSEAIEKLDIGFARSARRLQRALKEAIKRICQVHLAYMNMDPDPAMFDVCMNEGSTAEEEQARDSLDKGIDVIQKMLDTVDAADTDGTIDKKKIVDYLNKKILKLEDFDLNDFQKNIQPPTNPDVLSNETINESKDADLEEARQVLARSVTNTDLMSYLPLNENSKSGKFFNERHIEQWEALYGKVKISESCTSKKDKKDKKDK